MPKLFKHPILFLTLFLNYACFVKDKRHGDVSYVSPDTAVSAVIGDSEIIANEEVQEDVIMPDLSGTDSVFYYLIATKSKQKGDFAQAIIVTDSVVDAGNDHNHLLVVLLQTGTGSYAGIKSEVIPFETIYSTLALLQYENTTYTLLDYKILPISGGQGLYYNEVFCSKLKVSNERDAVVLHEIDSEEGAGDAGHTYHIAKLFIASNNKLTEVLSYPVSHFKFSSDEVEYYDEIKIETTLSVQPAEGFMKNILLSSTEIYTETPYKDLDFKGGNQLFWWNGRKYILYEDYSNF
ncbi:MAG: hypothetical protein EBR30_29680 [Cytophagia bacterium]|nr:hypothetical protein [Cytophagia bacterium]